MESKNYAKTQEKEVTYSLPSKKLIHPWRTFFFEAILFLATIILGIFSALKLIELHKTYSLPQIQPISFHRFTGAFLLATFFILFILIFRKRQIKAVIFKSIFVFTTFLGGIFTLSLWLPDLLALLFMISLILLWLKNLSPLLHNFCLILAFSGLGSILGLGLTPLIVVELLILFSIYDFIAVYKTKHMIKMAKEMIEVGVILGFIAPQKLSDFKISLKKMKIGGKFLILGGGDVIFPLLLAVSLVPESIFSALIVTFFSFIGLLASFLIFISQKVRAPIPALPPIAFFSLIGFLLILLLK